MWSGYRVVKCRCGCRVVEFGDPALNYLPKRHCCSRVLAKCLFLQLLTYCWSCVSTPLRRRITVIVVDRGQYSSTSEEIGGRHEHFVDLFAIEQLWTVTAVTVCLVSELEHWLREKWNWVNEKVLQWRTWVPHVVHCSVARRCCRLLDFLGRILRSASALRL